MSERKIERSHGMTPAQMEYMTDGVYTTFTFEDGRKTGIESQQPETVKIMVDAEDDTISLSRENGGMVTVECTMCWLSFRLRFKTTTCCTSRLSAKKPRNRRGVAGSMPLQRGWTH